MRNKEEILKYLENKQYFMSPRKEDLIICEELCKDGILIRADKAGERNPVGDFNSEYTFILAS